MGMITSDKDTISQVPEIKKPLNKESGSFPAEVFDNLPPLLSDACNVLADFSEREVFLVGGLAVLSGMFPNVHGFYDNQYYRPPLYVFVLAPYGSGKGSLKLARRLAQPIHKHIKEESATAIAEWKQECKDAAQNKEPEPPHPGNKMHFIPADNSKSGIIQVMHENDGRGTIFESEGDTLADTVKTDYGGYSDVLRKSYHHESVSIFRRTDQENRDIEEPSLAVLLSATFDQYTKLIPTPANGLFSRFIHFNLKSNPGFRDVFDTQRRDYPDYFNALGETFKGIYLELKKRETPIDFNLKEDQQKQFLKLFSQWKSEFGEYVSADMEGTANRLGLICFRISMVLSCVRCFGEGDFSDSMICEDVDFENALKIMEVLKIHALEVYNRLPKPTEQKEYADNKNDMHIKADKVSECRRLAALGMSYSKIAKEVLADENLKSTVYRWVNSEK